MVTDWSENSSSEAIWLQVGSEKGERDGQNAIEREMDAAETERTHVDDLGTTIAHSLSYFAVQSLRRLLSARRTVSGSGPDATRSLEERDATHFGTATNSVSMNSDSPVLKSSFLTMSPRDRVARFPLWSTTQKGSARRRRREAKERPRLTSTSSALRSAIPWRGCSSGDVPSGCCLSSSSPSRKVNKRGREEVSTRARHRIPSTPQPASVKRIRPPSCSPPQILQESSSK